MTKTIKLRRLALTSRVSQNAGIYQNNVFKGCTLFHIMPFAKMISPVKKKGLK